MRVVYCDFCHKPIMSSDTVAEWRGLEAHGGCLAALEMELMKDSRFEETGYSHYGELMFQMCDPRCRIHNVPEGQSPSFWALYEKFSLILLECELLEYLTTLDDAEALCWFMEADA